MRNALIWLSIFLCVVSAAAWLTGYRRSAGQPLADFIVRGERVIIYSTRGRGTITILPQEIMGNRYPYMADWVVIHYPVLWGRRPAPVLVPWMLNRYWVWWIPTAFFALPPALGFAARRRRIRLAKLNNLCVACGYDLRATPECCPECGRQITADVKPASEAVGDEPGRISNDAQSRTAI